MEQFIQYLSQKGTDVGLKLLLGLVVLIVGLKISKFLVNKLGKGKVFSKLDQGARSFLQSFIRLMLYVAVISSVAMIWGIPSTTFVTLLTSAGVAIGLALQGALSNLAGGLLILLFHLLELRCKGYVVQAVDYPFGSIGPLLFLSFFIPVL